MSLKRLIKRLLHSQGYVIAKGSTLQDFLDSRYVTLVLDVGANIGQYAASLRSNGYSGEIISFEPIKSVYETLCSNLSSDKDWKGINAALGSSRGRATLNVSESTVFSSFRPQSEYATVFNKEAKVVRFEEIDVLRLDDFADDLSRHRNIFCKIDTQGFEEEVLHGASGVLDQLCGIQLELPLAHLYEGAWSLSQATARLKELGFIPAQFRPVSFMTDDPPSWTEVDCVFRRASIPKPPSALAAPEPRRASDLPDAAP
jgi:FkbM family methyltransferase